MANSAVTGRVVDEHNVGLPNLVVGAWDKGGLFPDHFLPNTAGTVPPLYPAYAQTDSNGQFSISYTPGTHDLEVRVYDWVKRQLAVSPVFTGVSTPTFSLPTPILVTQATLGGWVANSGEFTLPIPGNEIELLVDNHDCWHRIVDDINQAHDSVNFMLFFVEIGVTLMDFSPDPPHPGDPPPTVGSRLEAVLRDAGLRGVAVRLLCNDFTALYGAVKVTLVDSAASVQRYFTRPVAPNVEVRRFATPFTTPVHTKFVVIDNDKAYVIGSPFIQDYYDLPTHQIEDPRHGTYNLVSASQLQVPTHDVNLYLRGPALYQLNKTFALHWDYAKPGAPSLPVPPAPAACPQSTSIQVVRTLHGNGRFAAMPHGETGVLESYQRAIANAQDYIYLENQYFTADEIAEALVFALKRRPALQLIFATNNKVDIPGYAKWQPATIQRVLAGLSASERKRVGFFTVWSHEPGAKAGDPTRILRNYLHSKVAVVDDVWATVGSANLDGVSLSTAQNAVKDYWSFISAVAGLRAPGNIAEDRASETNVVIFDGLAGQPASPLPRRLRRLLWAEHLGIRDAAGAPNPDDPSLRDRPPDGWLGLWRRAEYAKWYGLLVPGTAPITINPARVLRLPVDEGTPAERIAYPGKYPIVNTKIEDSAWYLKQLDIRVDKLTIAKGFRRYSFERNQWQG